MAAAQHEAAIDPNIYEIDHRVLVQAVELAQRLTPSGQQVDVDRLPRPIQAIYVTKKIDLEVLNGGFHQLFWNEPELARLGPDAFRAIGAPYAAELMAQVLRRVDDRGPAFDRRTPGVTLVDFAASAYASHSVWGGFDSSFFALADRLAGLRVRFAEGQREFGGGGDGRGVATSARSMKRWWRRAER